MHSVDPNTQLEPPLRDPSTKPIASHLNQPTLPTSSRSILAARQFYYDPTLYKRVMQLEEHIQQLSGRVKMIEAELHSEKRRSNQRDGRASKRRKLNVEARVLEKETERAAKAQEHKDAEIRRKHQALEREQQRRDCPADQPFTGALSSKKKPDLQEIAGALDLSEDGTKEVLISRINEFFEQKPDHCNMPRFSGLFNRTSKRRALPAETPIPSTSNLLQHHPHQPLAMNILNVCDAAAPGPSNYFLQ